MHEYVEGYLPIDTIREQAPIGCHDMLMYRTFGELTRCR